MDFDPKARIIYFKKKLEEVFLDNLPKKTISTLSNMLAFDFILRVGKSVREEEYSEKVFNNLRSFIGYKVFLNDSFDDSFTLFSIAISDKKTDSGSSNSMEEKIEVAIESFLGNYFPKTVGEEKRDLKNLFREIVRDSDIGLSGLWEYLGSGKKSLDTILNLSKNKNPKNKNLFKEILVLNQKLETKASFFKFVSSQATSILAPLVFSAAAVMLGGAFAPFIVGPAVLLSAKAGYSIGEKAADILLKNSQGIKSYGNLLDKFAKKILGSEISSKAEELSLGVESEEFKKTMEGLKTELKGTAIASKGTETDKPPRTKSSTGRNI